jgi:hypothetical protein
VRWDSSGYIKNETAFFTRAYPDKHSGGQVGKFENSLNLFMNADFTPNLIGHGEFRLIYDGGADYDAYQGYKAYTQHDYLRELYLDYSWDKFYFRLGKQQVVWGTADGIKLLDIINPTDFREFSQNTLEDSRIPIWMLKVERNIGEYGESNLQFVVSQPEENKIPGLNAGGDYQHPFVMKGVDAITGSYHGFLNITPALGMTALAFEGMAAQFTNNQSAKLEAVGGNTFSVQHFIDGQSPFCQGAPTGMPAAIDSCAKMLDYVAQTPGLGGNENRTNLVEATYDAKNPDNAFEYMANTSFSTFDSFAGVKTEYRRKYADAREPNLGLRFRGLMAGGLFNYSLNYFYHYDANPSLSMHWEDSQGGRLTPYHTRADGITGDTVTSVRLRKADGSDFVAADPLGNFNDGNAVLVFEESVGRVHSAGASFDYSLDSELLGAMVLRGELLYQHGVNVPVIDRHALSIGDITAGLKPQQADFFKYVLGADAIFLTNLMLNVQLIQFWNLDYIDEAKRYTGDPATLHLTNGLQRGKRAKTFISLYVSKPFGASQQGRVNNLVILEDEGGYWNRLDVAYSFADNLIGTAEWNHYWGEENSQFGQMGRSSSFQIGLKYLFD